jgi:hypothetical protein
MQQLPPHQSSSSETFSNQYREDGYRGRLVLTQNFTTGGPQADLTRSGREALHQQYTPDVLVFTSTDVGDMTTVLSAIPPTTQFAHLKVVMGTAAYAVIESGKSFTGYNRLIFSTVAFPDEWKFFGEAHPPLQLLFRTDSTSRHML